METAQGTEFGEVMIATKEVSDDNIVQPLKEVVRNCHGGRRGPGRRKQPQRRGSFRYL